MIPSLHAVYVAAWKIHVLAKRGRRNNTVQLFLHPHLHDVSPPPVSYCLEVVVEPLAPPVRNDSRMRKGLNRGGVTQRSLASSPFRALRFEEDLEIARVQQLWWLRRGPCDCNVTRRHRFAVLLPIVFP